MNKIIIFGAGNYGKQALMEYREQVLFFVDNNTERIGSYIEDIEIKPVKSILNKECCEVLVAVKNYEPIVAQLIEMGVTRYSIYSHNKFKYYPTKELIVNPYLSDEYFLDNSENSTGRRISETEEEVNRIKDENLLFDHVEIETINRCNGGCSFCPVSIKNESRTYAKMEENLFYSIIDQLSEIEYKGKIALFSNNEPFLDDRIIEFHKYTRAKLPYANMHLFTNGTLLSLDKFKAVIDFLDELIIDNYNQSLELIPTNKKIAEYCTENPDLTEKVTIVLRKVNEVLSSRGGLAPNKRIVSYPEAKCVLPFKQLIIRPDGKVSLCCNDALGLNTLGDLKTHTILEVWNNTQFNMVRKRLGETGRKAWNHCINCDYFSVG